MRVTIITLLITVVLIASFWVKRGPRSQDVLLVSAAVSLSETLAAIALEYERATGTSVVLNLAGSDTLASQLVAGVPADVFVSADRWQMDRVEDAGVIVTDSRINLLSNQLVVIVSDSSQFQISKADDVLSAPVRRIAIGDPEAVPAGVYAKQYFESKGLWNSVRSKVIPTRDVRAALAIVAAGDAEVGIVYRTDLTRTSGISVAFHVPVDEGAMIRYPAAVTVGAKAKDASRFLAFLGGDISRETFEHAGFILLPGKRSDYPILKP